MPVEQAHTSSEPQDKGKKDKKEKKKTGKGRKGLQVAAVCAATAKDSGSHSGNSCEQQEGTTMGLAQNKQADCFLHELCLSSCHNELPSK